MNYKMYDEMMEQPDSLRKTFESELSTMNEVSELVKKVDKVYLIGCGSSISTCYSVRDALRMSTTLNIEVFSTRAKEHIYEQCDDCRRCYDTQIGAELIPHRTTLCACSGDGRVGDKREIIAKEGSSYHDSNHPGCIGICLRSHSRGYRRKSHYRTHRCAHREGCEAGGKKDTRRQKLLGH